MSDEEKLEEFLSDLDTLRHFELKAIKAENEVLRAIVAAEEKPNEPGFRYQASVY